MHGYLERLITYADIPEHELEPDRISIALRHEVELADGRRILLLSDRGWDSGWTWTQVSREWIAETALLCVGPDEPYGGRSQKEMETIFWTELQASANASGLHVDATELARLPHDVVLSERLLGRISDGRGRKIP